MTLWFTYFILENIFDDICITRIIPLYVFCRNLSFITDYHACAYYSEVYACRTFVLYLHSIVNDNRIWGTFYPVIFCVIQYIIQTNNSCLFFVYVISASFCCDMGQNDTICKIELIPSNVLSCEKTNCKNDIQ